MIRVKWQEVLQGSWLLSCLIRICDRIRLRRAAAARRWRESGWVAGWAVVWKERPLQTGGLILVVSVLTNSFFSWLRLADAAPGASALWGLGRPMGAEGVGFRGALLLLGLLGLNSHSDWKAVRDGSFLIRFLNRGGNE